MQSQDLQALEVQDIPAANKDSLQRWELGSPKTPDCAQDFSAFQFQFVIRS